MKNAAAIDAQVVDIQNDRMHKGFIKVTLHVAAERGALLTKALGWPTYTEPVPVALARLDPERMVPNTDDKSTADKSPAPDLDRPVRARKPVDADKRLAQQAGICCADPVFQKFLCWKFDYAKCDEKTAADIIRRSCDVASRSEIKPETEAALKWEKIYSSFIRWRDRDIYVEPAQ